MSEETRPAWWNPWHWPWSVWAIAAVVLLMLLPFGVRTFFLSMAPAMEEPFDVRELLGGPIPPDEDAFTEYRIAHELRKVLVRGLQARSATEPYDFDDIYQHGWEAADEVTQTWLADHREALVHWRRGTERSHALAIDPTTMTFASTLEISQELRAFARLVMVDQMRCLHEGDVVEAGKLARAVYRSGGHATHGGPLISGLVGIALHAVSSEGYSRWAEHPAVTADQLREALGHVQADFALYEPQSNSLKAEFLALRNTMTGPGWVAMLGPVLGGPLDDGVMPSGVRAAFLWVVGEPEITVRLARQILANRLREIDKPLAERRKLVGSGFAMLFDSDPTVTRAPNELDADQIDRAVQMSILGKLLLPSAKHVDNAFLRFRARQAALEVLLAAQAYRRDQGEFPESLNQLVPQYLAVVPLDPSDPNGGRLLYRRDSATSAVVWGVGEDGNDSGGAVDSKTSRPADVGFVLKSSQ